PIFGPECFEKSGTDAVDGILRRVRAGADGRTRSRRACPCADGSAGAADRRSGPGAPCLRDRRDRARRDGLGRAAPSDTAGLACSDICIPGGADLALALNVAAAPAGPDPAQAALFAAARERLPQPAGFATRIAASGNDLRLHIAAAALAGIDNPTVSFFPAEP